MSRIIEVDDMNEKLKYCIVLRNHIKDIQEILNKLSFKLINRGKEHDDSKFKDPEFSEFSQTVEMDSLIEYGSEEHKNKQKKLEGVINLHHYNNTHHPEHWENGIEDMTLLDLLEMITDWSVASKKYKNGDVYKSLDINCKKYSISPQLKKILLNIIEREINT